MYTKAMVLPLEPDGLLYALQDEQGNHIGSGSREVCLTLLRLITNSALTVKPTSNCASINRKVCSTTTTVRLKPTLLEDRQPRLRSVVK